MIELERAAVQPITTDLRMADGVFAKTMCIQKAGTYIPQHSHVFPHMSVLVRGSVRVWAGGMLVRDFVAPDAVLIRANIKHMFMSLADDTIVLCVHDIRDGEGPEIADEHHIAGLEPK